MKKTAILLAGVLISGLILLSCGSSDSSNKTETAKTISATPESSGPTFAVYDINGRIHKFEDFLGQPLVLNFWGTWCPPCRRELPDLKKIYSEFGPLGLQIVGLAVNDHPQKVKVFAEKMGLDWVMLIADKEALKSFNVGTGVPVTIFFDRHGNETARAIGMKNYEYFKSEIEKII